MTTVPPLSSPPGESSECVELLDDYLERRRRSGIAMSTGEVVTLLVPFLRGAGTAGRDAVWGLTREGRPVPCPPAQPPAILRTVDGLRRLAPPDIDAVVAEVRRVLERPSTAAASAAEERVFHLGEPRPLVLGPLRPVIADEPEEDAGGSTGLLALVDADLRTAVAAALRDARRRWRRRAPASSRRRVVLWAAAAVLAAVVAVGVTAVAGPGDGGGATPGVTGGSVADRPMEDEDEDDAVADLGPSAAPDVSPDGVPNGIRRVVEAAGACGSDTVCLAPLREAPPSPDEPELLPPAGASMALVDDFGGLVVLRLEVSGRRQYVTLVRVNDRWLVRAAGAITDQPS
ncbi:hypothetical protein ACO03V_08500 [Microbacterium sp. HMH0099]|uniref:hypothetical protein n=1 Tax=Microbacterium sp. HMH0099 TaxID=3414026 RepID=UPI003BF70C0B